jgi:hypothetical protein
MEMKRAAVSIIIFSSSFMALVIFCVILSVRLYRASAIDSGKRIFSQCTFYQNIKNICLNSSYNTLLLLKTVKTWNISQEENKQLAKLLIVTPRECLQGQGLLPNAGLYWQVRTRVIQPGEFLGKLDQLFHFVNLILDYWPDLLKFDIQPPPWGLCLLSSQGLHEVRDMHFQHVPPAEKPECGVFMIAEASHCSREYSSVGTCGVAAHSKDLIYNVIVLSQVQDNISLIRAFGRRCLKNSKSNVI